MTGYEVYIRVEKLADSAYYRATGHVSLSGSSDSKAAYSTEPQFSYHQDRAVSYALTELAVAFDRGMVR